MNIQSLLKDKNIYFPLKYHGASDFATRWNVKTLIDNQELFRKVISNIKQECLQNKEEFFNYLICLKISKLKEIEPLILLDENKAILRELSQIAEEAICSINAGHIVKLINAKYKELLESGSENYDLREITLDYICQYKRGISFDVFEYITENYGYLYIDRFEDFAEVLEKYPELFERVFEKYNFDELRLRRILDVWTSIMRKRESELKPIVAKYNDVLFESIVSAANDSSQDIYVLNNRVNIYYDFLRLQQDVKANQMYEIKRTINDKCEEEVIKRGDVFTTQIPVGEIVKHWKASETNELKLLYLTHSRRDQGKMLSSLSFETTEKSLLDFVQSNVKTDDFFSSSHLLTLSSIEAVSKATLIGLLNDKDTRIELYNLLSSSVATVFSAAHVNEKDIISEINTLLVSINLIQENKNITTVNNSVNYGFCMYTCALMEKILRAVYYDQASSEIYVRVDGMTIGDLINETNNYMNKLFDSNHIKNLRYFLLKDNQTQIGKNIRNSLAHLSEISICDVTYDLCMTVLWLLIDIVNSIILFYIDNNDGKIEFIVLQTLEKSE